jgi:alkanesulfonate monooxygenase SsuD/methylene tetrahydromethanopterin reductase-like flavin-dependent oxidoreductase (luciferase family)
MSGVSLAITGQFGTSPYNLDAGPPAWLGTRVVFDKAALPRFGIMHDFRRPSGDPSTTAEYYAQCLAEAAEADRLGYDMVWLSEHHFTDDGMLPSPLVAAAAVAARTSHIGIGTNVLVLPLHHPLRVAEDAAVVDLISGGRLVLAVGQGYAPAEFAGFGVDRTHRPGRLEEGISVLRQAWDDAEVTVSGRHWRIAGVPVRPQPGRRVPLLVGAVAERAVERAVRIGDGLIVYCGKPADFVARRQLLDGVLAANPRREFPVVLTSILHVAPDAEQAWAEARPGIAYLEGQLSTLRDASQASFDRADFLVGTPADVAERLATLYREAPFDHFAHWARLPGLSHERAVETLRMVAAHVVPAVRRRID